MGYSREYRTLVTDSRSSELSQIILEPSLTVDLKQVNAILLQPHWRHNTTADPRRTRPHKAQQLALRIIEFRQNRPRQCSGATCHTSSHHNLSFHQPVEPPPRAPTGRNILAQSNAPGGSHAPPVSPQRANENSAFVMTRKVIKINTITIRQPHPVSNKHAATTREFPGDCRLKACHIGPQRAYNTGSQPAECSIEQNLSDALD